MFKSLILAAAMIVSASAHAYNTFGESIFAAQQAKIQSAVVAQGLNWKVGDENNYKLNMGGFLNGTMKMSIREIGADGIWMVQDVDLKIQKQKIEVLLDPNTGEIKKMLVNGQEQAPPKSEYEVIDQKEDRITVPAGTYDAIYIKVKDKANGDQITEQWVNPRDIPLSGMLKSLADSQLGKVTIELTSFKH
jgi:sporulation protein YlmC with PRC-barrel domain